MLPNKWTNNYPFTKGHIRGLAIAMVFFCSIFTTASHSQSQERFQKVLARFVEAYNALDYEKIQSLFGGPMLAAFPLQKSRPFFEAQVKEYGKIITLDSPRYVPPNRAVVLAHYERGSLEIIIILDNEDRIIGIQFQAPKQNVPVPDKNETKLILPFKGRWLVSSGGDTKELNSHHEVPNQKFAFDFVGVDESGNAYRGDGRKNEDHYCFGREVLAPGDGTVIEVIEGVRDNAPGSLNPYSALGNAILIQHLEKEVSVLAHLMLGSTRVRVGEKVKEGQVIGKCGNSGNSSRPHLHYHLQNSPIIQDGIGIKCYFKKVILIGNGKKVEKMNYSPIRGNIISSE